MDDKKQTKPEKEEVKGPQKCRTGLPKPLRRWMIS